jgi:hypothetical protein
MDLECAVSTRTLVGVMFFGLSNIIVLMTQRSMGTLYNDGTQTNVIYEYYKKNNFYHCIKRIYNTN